MVDTIASTIFTRFLNESVNRLVDRLQKGDALSRIISEKLEETENAIVRKLDDITTNDLRTSISKYKQAIALVEFHITDREDGSADVSPENLFEVNLTPVSKDLFKEAKGLADKAVNYITLSVPERILAMTILIKSTLLGMDSLSDALVLCKNFLKEMHGWENVQADFQTELTGKKWWPNFYLKQEERRQTIASVCKVNRIVFDVIQKVGGERIRKEFFVWPCIEIDGGNSWKKEKIDPLRDKRLHKILQTQIEADSEKDGCLVVRAFGDEILLRPHSIATDSQDQFIVVETERATVFDSRGKYRYTLNPPVDGASYVIIDVDTDRDDRVYLLVEIKNDNEEKVKNLYAVFVFDNQGAHVVKFRLNPAKVGRKLAVWNFVPSSKVLILEGAKEKGRHAVVEVYETQSPRLLTFFGSRHLEDAQDISAANDGRIFVLDQSHHNGHKFVREFSAENFPQLLRSFSVHADSVALTFDTTSNHIVIVSVTQKGEANCGKVSIYQLSGLNYQTPVFSLELHEYVITNVHKQNVVVTATGRIAVVLESIGTTETTEQASRFWSGRKSPACEAKTMGRVVVV